jgi:hypothetical protein
MLLHEIVAIGATTATKQKSEGGCWDSPHNAESSAYWAPEYCNAVHMTTLKEFHKDALKNLEKAHEKNVQAWSQQGGTKDGANAHFAIGDYVLAQGAKWSKIHLDADTETYRVTRFTGKGCIEVEDAKGTRYSYKMNNVKVYAKKKDVEEAAL